MRCFPLYNEPMNRYIQREGSKSLFHWTTDGSSFKTYITWYTPSISTVLRQSQKGVSNTKYLSLNLDANDSLRPCCDKIPLAYGLTILYIYFIRKSRVLKYFLVGSLERVGIKEKNYRTVPFKHACPIRCTRSLEGAVRVLPWILYLVLIVLSTFKFELKSSPNLSCFFFFFFLHMTGIYQKSLPRGGNLLRLIWIWVSFVNHYTA